jgi:hypothetical protein
MDGNAAKEGRTYPVQRCGLESRGHSSCLRLLAGDITYIRAASYLRRIIFRA